MQKNNNNVQKAENKSTSSHKQDLSQSQPKVILQQQYSGPIPSPQDLASYEKIYPGLANRLVIMAEKEIDHRHDITHKSIDLDFKYKSRGQLCALILGCMGIIVGGITAVLGSAATGSIIGGTTVIALAGIFVIGKYVK